MTFSSSLTVQTVQVSIANDSLLEIDEVFTVSFSLENPADVGRIELELILASVTISDDDGTDNKIVT